MPQLSQLLQLTYKLIDSTFKAEDAKQYRLYIYINNQELVYTIYDTQQERYISLQSDIYDTQSNDVIIAERFSDYIRLHKDMLTLSYDKINVIVSYPQANLVPAPLYDKLHKKEYINFHFTLLEKTAIYSNYIKQADAYCIFAVPEPIQVAVAAVFPQARFHHHSTTLIAAALKDNKINASETVYLNFSTTSVDIVIVKNEKLQLYNAYEYSNVEDVLYYVLNTLQQLKLSADTIQVILCGNINATGALYTALKTYLANISFAKRTNAQQYSYALADVPAHEQFCILNSHLCEL